MSTRQYVRRWCRAAFLSLLVLCVAAFAYAADSRWQPLKGYWPAGPLVLDKESIEYDSTYDTASMWVKWHFKDGSVRRNHYYIDFKRASMQCLYSGDFSGDDVLMNDSLAPQEPFPIAPDSWQEQSADIITAKVGRKPLYGTGERWKWIGIGPEENENVFLGTDTTTYNSDEHAAYVWILVKKDDGTQSITCYKCSFIGPFRIGQADSTFDPPMDVARNAREELILKSAYSQHDGQNSKMQ